MGFIMFSLKKLTAEDYFFITISSYSFLILLSMLIKSFDLSNYNSFIEKANPTIFFAIKIILSFVWFFYTIKLLIDPKFKNSKNSIYKHNQFFLKLQIIFLFIVLLLIKIISNYDLIISMLN